MTNQLGPAHLREMDEAEPTVSAEVSGMPERIWTWREGSDDLVSPA